MPPTDGQLAAAEMKQQLTRDLLHDARIFAAHRENAARDPFAVHEKTQRRAFLLASGDVHLSNRNRSGSKWRPPPTRVITDAAEEINSLPLPPVPRERDR